MATDADILLMDEAISALDPLIRNDMQAQLKALQLQLKKTIVFITHDLDEALLLGDRIAILKDGELRQTGTGSDILLRPADDYVRRFVRDVNRLRVVTVGDACEASTQAHETRPTMFEKATLETALPLFADGAETIGIINADGQPVGLLTRTQFLIALGSQSA